MNQKCVNKIIEVAEADGWCVTHNKGDFEFSKYSPAGQDFNMCISAESLTELNDNLYEYWNGFDCSEEAYIWLDDFGHGKNGAPYDMKDVYEDMKACEEMIRELAGVIKELDYNDIVAKPSQKKTERSSVR